MVATLEKPETKTDGRANNHGNAGALVVTKQAQEWAKLNGFRSELAGAEALMAAYRDWQASAQPKGYDTYSVQDLEKLTAKYNKRLAAIQAAAQRKTR